ncbi:hypothetical protein Ga0058931_0748 [Roseibaca calidilacus]|uniref:Ankyrin repeat domain-containing protein n=2 Tax=Roseibaca calidilacus TaxID=1666912 RepID=A0ABP2BWB3_9RHOB|nr:hypothetical protein Ga0058931_0748 [Roseibaca calidilacus]
MPGDGRQEISTAFATRPLVVLFASIGFTRELHTTMTETDMHALDVRGQSIIFQHVMEEDTQQITALLDAGLPIDIRGFQDSTPALYAAMADIWPVVLFLLERGADPMAANRLGMTLPWLATTSRINGDGPRARALGDVRAVLADRDLLSCVYPIDEVRAMVAERRWPPAPQRRMPAPAMASSCED